MAGVKVYSFQEVSLSLHHPDLGILTITGEGAGTLSISMDADRTEKKVGSDGTVVFSKIRDRSGAFSITVFNTSNFHTELKRRYNYLEQASADLWAMMSFTLTSKSTLESMKGTGVAFTKLPDAEFDSTSKVVTWSFMVADIQQNVI